jgi:hypothetical protein
MSAQFKYGRVCMNMFSSFQVRRRKASSISIVNHIRFLTVLFSAICLLSMSSLGFAQTQLGANINGEAIDDGFGYSSSLSSDGHRLAVGAFRNDGNGTDSGHVRLYQLSGSTWVQLGTDINGEATDDNFGRAVSISSDGNRVAIGASGNDGNGTDSGHVRVYQWSNSTWTQLGADINGEAAYDIFGRAVSLSSDGNRVAIGAPGNDGIRKDSGHVRVYQWSNSTWTQLGSDIDGEAENDRSGYSVSLSGDGNHLAVGARLNDGNGADSGHVRVYQWSGSTWTQRGAEINGEAASDNSGYSVSLSDDGKDLAIGAPQNDDNGDTSGHVRVYQWSNSVWMQRGADIDGEAANDQSGGRVSLSSDGNRLAIGAIYNDRNDIDIDSGHTRVYQWSDTAWEKLGTDINGEAIDDWLGSSVSLSSNGSRLAVGASGNDSNGMNSGRVQVYDLSMFNVFGVINPGLNDAWYNPDTDGQGFYIAVFYDRGLVSLAWFTYDTELPPPDAVANLPDPGHRWLTALGPIDGDQAVMNITLTSGGIFDAASEIDFTDPPGSDGTITLTFDGCNSGTVEYNITSINRQGIIPIQRVTDDNIVFCEALKTD